MPPEKAATVRHKVALRKRERDMLGLSLNQRTADKVYLYSFGKCVLLFNKDATKTDVMRSLRIINEQVAMDNLEELKEKEMSGELDTTTYTND